MALQTLSTTGTSPAATASPTVDPTPGEGAQLNTRNSVPFSFLIAFLALFVVFMGMGLWARRIVFFARRQLGLPIPEPPRRRRPVLAQKPVLWDVYPDSRVQPQKWEGMEPLSSWFCREEAALPVLAPEPPMGLGWPPDPPVTIIRGAGGRAVGIAPPRTPSPSPPRRYRDRIIPLQSLREWWLDLVHPMRHDSPKSALNKDKTEAVQVAVFISMPSQQTPETKRASRGLERLGELAIGIAGFPWEYDDAALDIPETRT